jgi:membrane-bound lytic murein transglycosylase A
VPELKGKHISGRVAGDQLVPYHDRAAITTKAALAGQNLELFWTDDPVAAFFLEIQGSGQLVLPDGHRARVGYAGQNGRTYRAIGKDLVEAGAIPKEGVSLQAIRDWLRANPDAAAEMMSRNPSYVFFRELRGVAEGDGPLGAQGVPLTPGRSLAVDRRFLPLGVPLWLETVVPVMDGPDAEFRHLVIAQDTGGAIKGPVRGDLFWGAGPEAEHGAGHMQSRGGYFALLPRSLAPAT